jgi:hypothetical protein
VRFSIQANIADLIVIDIKGEGKKEHKRIIILMLDFTNIYSVIRPPVKLTAS